LSHRDYLAGPKAQEPRRRAAARTFAALVALFLVQLAHAVLCLRQDVRSNHLELLPPQRKWYPTMDAYEKIKLDIPIYAELEPSGVRQVVFFIPDYWV